MIPRFRAWNKKTQSFIDYGDLVLDLRSGKIYAGDIGLVESTIDVTDQIELMQSTGLKDKNGVEIFEGDVVAVENHPFQRKEDSGVGMEIEGNYVVGWNQHDLTWCAGDLLLARLKPYVKVIGNIYENPELLEEEMR